MIYPEWEYKKGRESIFQVMMTENFPKLISDTKANIQEAQRTLGKINGKKRKKEEEKRKKETMYVGISYSTFRK